MWHVQKLAQMAAIQIMLRKKFQCIRKENFLLEKELKKLKNNERKDFTLWKKGIENRCESKKSYTLGEGVGLVKEECYRGEYINRLNEIGRDNGRVLKAINKKMMMDFL